MIDEQKAGICADCEPKAELRNGKWRLRQRPQTSYQLEFSTYIRWLEAQPRRSIVGDVSISDQCTIHNWLASLGIDVYVYNTNIMDPESYTDQELPDLFIAVQHEMDHELDLDLHEADDGLITREAALLCAYRVLLQYRQPLIESVA
jgi:hypothetical protein